MQTIKDIRLSTGLSSIQFSTALNIPIGTFRSWEHGRTNPPEYVVELIVFRVMNDPNFVDNAKGLNLDCPEMEKPCNCCILEDNPNDCNRKNCHEWQKWWVYKWESMRKIKYKKSL